MRVKFTCQYFVVFGFLKGTFFFSQKGEDALALLWGPWMISLYLAPVWKDWALGHLQALCQGGSWGQEVGALGASARTLLTD